MEGEIIRYALAFTLVLFSLPAWAKPSIPYSALTPAQQALFGTFVTEQNAASGGSESDESYWEEKLDDSQATTFASITHAMENTPLANDQPALSLITSVEEIHGAAMGAASYRQFNLRVAWSQGAEALLRKSGFRWRWGHGHDGEHGISRHGGIRGLHLLFNNKDSRLGHLHVDYRWLTEGHEKAYNADVRASGPQVSIFDGQLICNRCRHERWYGKIEGWPGPWPQPQP
jgi:hypothetical protein